MPILASPNNRRMNPVNTTAIPLDNGKFMDVYPNGDYTIYSGDPGSPDWDGNLTAFDSGGGPVNYQAVALLELRHQRLGHDTMPIEQRATQREAENQRGLALTQENASPQSPDSRRRSQNRHPSRHSTQTRADVARQVFSRIANRLLIRNQVAYEIEFRSFAISLMDIATFRSRGGEEAKIKLNLRFSGIFELQNVNNHPDFRFVLNEGVVEQRVEGRLTQIVTREFTTSWQDLVLQRIYRAFGVGTDSSSDNNGFDLESALMNAVTLPRILQGERGDLEWNFTPNPSISLIPPKLSLYVISTRRQFINHSFGALTVVGIPIELRFNGALVVELGLSAGGWKWVIRKMIRQMGWEPAIAAFKQRLTTAAANVARASPIPLLSIVLGFAIKYALEEITRAARIRGYNEGLAMAYATGFTRTLWVERNFETGARSEARRTREAYEKGVDDAVRLLTVLARNNSEAEVARAARDMRDHLRRAFSLNINAERSQVAYYLAIRISAGGSIPNPTASLPY